MDLSHVDRVLATAVVRSMTADISAAPSIQEALRSRRLSPDGLRNMAMRDLENYVKGKKSPAIFPNLRTTIRTQMNVEEEKLRGGVGQWDAIFSAIGAVAGAAGTVYSTKITTDATKKIADINLQKQSLALQSEQLAAQAANTQVALSQGTPSAIVSGQSVFFPAGTPGWVDPVVVIGGVGALATILYFATRKRR